MEEGGGEEEKRSRSSLWTARRGAAVEVGKKAAVAGAAIASAPVVVPPLLVFSAVGLAFAFPFGVYFAAFACTHKLISSLLPILPPHPQPQEEDNYFPTSPPSVVEWEEEEEEEEEVIMRCTEYQDAKGGGEEKEIIGEESTGGTGEEEAQNEAVVDEIRETEVNNIFRVDEVAEPPEERMVVAAAAEKEAEENNTEKELTAILQSLEYPTVAVGASGNDDGLLLTESEEVVIDDWKEPMTTTPHSFVSVVTSAFASEMEASVLSSDRPPGVTDAESSTLTIVKSVDPYGVIIREASRVEEGGEEHEIDPDTETIRRTVVASASSRDGSDVDESRPSLEYASAVEERDGARDRSGELITASHSFASVVSAGFASEMDRPSSPSSDYASAMEDRLSGVTDAESVAATDVESASVRHSDYEAIGSEERIWEQIHALRTIVGYKTSPQSALSEELKALYLFTGVEPPVSLEEAPDLIVEVGDKLRFLKAVIGVI